MGKKIPNFKLPKTLKRIPELPKVQKRNCEYTGPVALGPIIGHIDPKVLKSAPIVGKINLKK